MGNLVIPGNSASAAEFYPTAVDAIYINTDSSEYLSWAGGTGDSTRTFTIASWFKTVRTQSTTGYILNAGASGDEDTISWSSGRVFCQLDNAAGGNVFTYQFTLTSLWAHVVVAVDTTQATSTDRVKIYINGIDRTNTGATYPAQNYDTLGFGTSTGGHRIASSSGAGPVGGGLHADVYYIDGAAELATAFGEFNSRGVWVPKAYSGSFGTNGFHLNFANSSDLGNDVSGNNNDFTLNGGMGAANATNDTPTSPACSWSMINNPDGGSKYLDDGAQHWEASSSTWHTGVRTDFRMHDKHYWEFTYNGNANELYGIGWVDGQLEYTSTWSIQNSGDEDFAAFQPSTGDWKRNNTTKYNGASWTSGDVGCIAFDAATGKVWVGKISGGSITWENSGDPPAGTGQVDTVDSAKVWTPCSSAKSAQTANHEFGQTGFAASSLPTGFLELNHENAEDQGTFDIENGTETATDHFGMIKWTGNGSTTRSFTGLGFQPDLVLIRKRTGTVTHIQFYDAVRGANIFWDPTSTAAESSSDTNGYLSSFDADGFSVADGATNGLNVNNNSDTYMAYCWKMNGSGSSNTDGTITSTVSYNANCEMSIVTYTGNGTAGATVGHGLSAAPELIIVKNRDSAVAGVMYHKDLDDASPQNYHVVTNSTAARTTGSNPWNTTAPGATTFTISAQSSVNTNTDTYVAYCFRSVSGFSKVGRYVGIDTLTNGTAVHAPMHGSFIWIKRRDATADWAILDHGRGSSSANLAPLWTNKTDVEGTAVESTFYEGGFRQDGKSNAWIGVNNGVYCYLMFGELGFRRSNGKVFPNDFG